MGNISLERKFDADSFLNKNLCPKMSRSLGIWYIMFRKTHISKGIGQ